MSEEVIKLKFVEQDYQNDAVNSIVDIFDGCEVKESPFVISKKADTGKLFDELGYSNKLTISDNQIFDNLRKVQERNGIQKDKDFNPSGMNFTIEMETGTGKTYVYTKTILELNKKYGWTKFIVVVPSVAIKEGVAKSIELTKDHFALAYDNVPYDYFVYDSNKISKLKTFANSSTIQIMIMTIGAFNKSLEAQDSETKANLIFRPSDKLDGCKGIDLINLTHPVVIIDEPQSVDNTSKAKKAIAALNPLCTLRYSATHKELYHLMYRLSPVDAYQQHLVKGIEVDEVLSDDLSTTAYVKLISVSGEGGSTNRAIIDLLKKDKNGTPVKTHVSVKAKDDLWDVSNEIEYYQGNGYIVKDIDAIKDNQKIEFSNGVTLRIGEAIGLVNDESIKRAQIRETIYDHLKKEKSYIDKGIKVLSLIFIDKVDNYLDVVTGEKTGKYAQWFEEEFEKLINTTFKNLKDSHPEICFDPKKVHDGYFSKDSKKRFADTKGDGENDDTTYNLIMKEKGKLLSMKTAIRFIFSHSALKEGWDNPNVFQVCTLLSTDNEFKKRQQIGRGLRICVNQQGERVLDPKFNSLTVIANESYKDFCNGLQKEYQEHGYKFGIIETISFEGLSIKDEDDNDIELSQDDSIKIHEILVKAGYIDKNKATTKFFQDKQNGSFETNEEFKKFNFVIAEKVESLSKELVIKNTKEKVKVNKNDKVINSDIFNEIWKKINQKTIYSVHLPIEQMKQKAIQYIKDMPTIKKEKIGSRTVAINIERSGVTAKDAGVVQKTISTFEECENPNYPDFVRRLTDSTQLLRGTIIEILAKSGRLSDFYNNPEYFIKVVSKLIIKAKQEFLLDGLQYSKVDDFYKQEEIFDDTELFGIKGRNIVDISNPDKNPLDHVIFDSAIEKAFAEACDQDDDVVLYAKLPSRFTIDTPFGNYNPDWMIVLKDSNNDDYKLYFVAETKGTTDLDNLRPEEKNKILCGRKHFEVLNNELKYKVVKTLIDLKDNEMN